MKRDEIKKLHYAFEQIKELEFIYEDINGDGADDWWKISTPHREISISDDETRLRFTEFIESEIKLLKEKISLED